MQLRDPGDDMVFEAAVNGRADALVSHNLKDLGTRGLGSVSESCGPPNFCWRSWDE